MVIKKIDQLKQHLSRAAAIVLLSSVSFGASAQSYDWVIPPATRINFNGATGVPSSMPGIGCTGGTSWPGYLHAPPQVISTSSASDPAFDFVLGCGTYNLSGTKVANAGYRNVFPIPGICKQYYAVEWTQNHYPTNNQLVVRKLDATNPLAVVETASVDLFSDQVYDAYSHTVAIAPIRFDGSRIVYFYDHINQALKSVTISVNGTIGAVQYLCSVSLSGTTFAYQNQMEVSPNGKYVLFSDNNGNLWSIDVMSGGYATTNLAAGLPGTGRHIHGFEYVPMPGGDDRVYISWHGAQLSGGLHYVSLSNPGVATNTFATVTLPSTTSQLSWGYTEIERGRDGQLYLANRPNPPVETDTTPGLLYALNIANNTLLPVKINGTTQVYIKGGGNGYKIQTQIDGETFKSYSLSPSYTLNGLSQNNPPVIPEVILCDNTPMTIQFATGGYFTSAGITLQKGIVSGNTFTPQGFLISTIGNPLGAPSMGGSVNVGQLFNLGNYTGGVQFTLTFNNGCGNVSITQTFNIKRAGLVADFTMKGPGSCTPQNRVTNISQLANSGSNTQPASSIFCRDGWLGAVSVEIKQPTVAPTGVLTIQNYILSVQEVNSSGVPVPGGLFRDSIQTTPFNDLNLNTLTNGWFITNYTTIRNSAYFKVTLGVNTTPCGLIERYSYFRIIDGGAGGNWWKQTFPGLKIGGLDKETAQVYPNPAKGKINLSWHANSDIESKATFQLNNTLGKVVLQQALTQQEGSNEAVVDVSRLAPGIYYYQLEANGTIYKGKITLL
ncbi:hypothetical protein DBR32_09360 [Taibaiella sp. KBW10]|uniref:T9SS type A sorting domain-containing protein n=1 Tax=Taibaiella sp. KBW10 TaxID=2153357 RepID=UPI000F5ACBA2|nr:T9SS type A sorting domain-containing protein [Taibaiella sp. KBW10]RQO30909.1 hypothetical protein DBR32_09360 [Taibaiella sp. KBW10]